MHRELDVAAAGLDLDGADDPERGVPHVLVAAIRERLGRRHGDRVAGVHAHGIEVLDRADDDHVVGKIAHHLKFVFFPPEHRFFDQDFVHWGKIQAPCQNFKQLFTVVSDTTTGSAESKGRTNDDREPNLS